MVIHWQQQENMFLLQPKRQNKMKNRQQHTTVLELIYSSVDEILAFLSVHDLQMATNLKQEIK